MRIWIIAFMLSCKPWKDYVPVPIRSTCQFEFPAKEGSYALQEVDSLFFRRSFLGQENMEGQEWENYLNRNPDLIALPDKSGPDSFYRGLCRKGYIVDDLILNLEKIETLPNEFSWEPFPGRIVQVKTRLIQDPKLNSEPFVEFVFKEDGKRIGIDSVEFEWPPDYCFFKEDLNDDGIEELISVYQYYIVNGDNFNVKVYQLKDQGFEGY